MKRISMLIAIVSVLALGVTTGLAQQSGYDLYQKALVKERAEGDIAEAISLYQRVVREHGSNRALAAKAQYRIGLLYERLGRRADAQRAYQTVVNQYNDQTEVARDARAKIPANGNATAKGRAKAIAGGNKNAANTLTVRQVWPGQGADNTGTPSLDGKYLSFVDWETGDLAIHDLNTGDKRRLTKKGTWLESSEFAFYSTISPDGKQVAYAWANRDGFYELRVVGIEGSKPRVLYRNEEARWVHPFDWSPDGKRILALVGERIALVSAADGSTRFLKSLDWRYPTKMTFSPDGEWIAYDAQAREDSPNREILILGTDGSRETPLVKYPANNVLLGWLPDGKRILFASDRSGTMDAWLMPVADGKPQGAAELVKPDVGRISPIGFTRKGFYYYGLDTGTNNVYIAELDPATGKLLAPPTPASERFVGYNFSPDWSPDGQSLLYLSRQNPTSGELGERALNIHAFKTGEVRMLTTKLLNMNRPRWSPDGRSILVRGRDHKSHHGLFLIDAQTWNVTALLHIDPNREYIQDAVWSRDGRAIIYARRDSAKRYLILMRDVESGQEKELYRTDPDVLILSIALSPNGERLAFTTRLSVVVVPIKYGESREVMRVPEGLDSRAIAWTQEGRHLLFGKQNKAVTELWKVPLEGGAPQKLDLSMVGLRDLRLHPDGRRVAFTAGQFKSEVWVMENILSAQTRKASVSRR